MARLRQLASWPSPALAPDDQTTQSPRSIQHSMWSAAPIIGLAPNRSPDQTLPSPRLQSPPQIMRVAVMRGLAYEATSTSMHLAPVQRTWVTASLLALAVPALSLALMAYGFAWRNADADRALKVMQRGLAIAHDSGNRFNESHLTANLAQLEVERGDPLSALDHIGLAIRHMHESGNMVTIRSPLTNLAIFLDRGGHFEPAAAIAGFAFSPLTAATFPNINNAITHLRDVLGDQAFESLARKGETMTTAEMVTYAYDQIDQARAELNTVLE